MERKTKKRKKKTWLTVLIIALLGVLGVFVGRYAYVIFVDPMSAFQQPETPKQTQTPAPAAQSGTQAPTPVPEPTLSPEEELARLKDAEFMKNRVNILMLGWDESPERTEAGSALYRDEGNNFRSDVLMILSVDFENGKAELISIPRDTMSYIYNTTGRWKINAAFAKGGSAAGEGFSYAINTIKGMTGLPISHYAGVNMSGIKAVVDAMGGVDYDVDVRIELNGRVLETGYQHLNGQQVLDYCRARKGISTDVGRADRQQRILFAIFEQLKSKNQLVNLPNIYLSVKDYITTDLTLEQIAALASFGMDLSMENLSRYTLEGEYVNSTPYSGASFYVLDQEKLTAFLQGHFGLDFTPDPTLGLTYVQADKAAYDGQKYVSAADYLLYLTGNAQLDPETGTYMPPYFDYDAYRQGYVATPLAPLLAARWELEQAALRASYDPESKELFLPDTQTIATTQEALRQALYNLCYQYNITKQNVEKSKLPGDFYSVLPAQAWGLEQG